MNYHIAEPTPPPKSNMKKGLVLSLMAILFLLFAWQFGVSPYMKKFDEWKSDSPVIGKVLDPGFHFVTKIPFVVTIPSGHIGVLEDGGWYYDTYYYKETEIPPGHKGLVYDTEKGYNSQVLTPGRYRINPHQFEVILQPAEK